MPFFRYLRVSTCALVFGACSPAEPTQSNGSFAAAATMDAGVDSAVNAAAVSDTSVSPSVDAGASLGATKDAASARDAAINVMDAAPSDAGLLADAALALDAAWVDGASWPDGAQADAASDAASGDAAAMLPAAQARTVMVGTASRTYLLYVPKGLDKARPVPLVSVHHGYHGRRGGQSRGGFPAQASSALKVLEILPISGRQTTHMRVGGA